MFNKETEYALRGLIYIQSQNNEGKRPGVTEVAEQIDAPHSYTAKILQRLVRLGLIESQKGKGGGFYFDKNKPDLLLKQLINSIEGETLFIGCGFGLKKCDENNPCPLHERYAPIRNAFNQLVSEESIQSMARKTAGLDGLAQPKLK